MSAGRLPDGRAVRAVELASGDLSATLLDYGARLVAFRRGGGPNACVASATLADYTGRLRYAGPVIGPVINRIRGAEAEISGRVCTFEANQDNLHSLHSGPSGTWNAIWTIAAEGPSEVTFEIDLPDGAGGFPGNRRITARYALDEGGLTLEITATTDAPTLMNPGLHGVWCPGGPAAPASFRLTIPAETHLPVDADTLPTGEIAPVAGTAFDHRHPGAPDPALDHNFCFAPGFRLRAQLVGKDGTALEIHSDAPGLQAYAGGRDGVALEPQLWPDAPHHGAFPSIILHPGETFRQRTRVVLTP